jgi:purine-nucleoside phosphorylase
LPESYTVAGLLSYGAWDEKKYVEKLNQTLSDLHIEYTLRPLEGFLSHIYEIKTGKGVYWFTMLYGGAMLSEYVHLACIFGSKRNIHIGSCGGLYPEMNSTDLIVPEWSYGNDSITRTYAREILDNKHMADVDLSELIKSKISIPNKLWTGPVINCQAMLGETLEDVQTWSRDGYYGVEMETATVFSVSNHYKIPCAALMYVGDNLIKGQTVHDEDYINQKDLRELIKTEIYKVGINVIMAS